MATVILQKQTFSRRNDRGHFFLKVLPNKKELIFPNISFINVLISHWTIVVKLPKSRITAKKKFF